MPGEICIVDGKALEPVYTRIIFLQPIAGAAEYCVSWRFGLHREVLSHRCISNPIETAAETRSFLPVSAQTESLSLLRYDKAAP